MKISESRLRQIIREELTSGEAPKKKTVFFRFAIPYVWVRAKGNLYPGKVLTDLFEGDDEAPLSAVVVEPEGGWKIVDQPPGPIVEFEFTDGAHGYAWAFNYGVVSDRNEFYRGAV